MEDFYSAISQMISVSSWCGLCPFQLRGEAGHRTLHLSTPGVFYNVALASYFAVIYFVEAYFKWAHDTSVTITDILHIFHGTIDILICITAVTLCCTNGRRSIRVFKSVEIIDKDLAWDEERLYKDSKRLANLKKIPFMYFLSWTVYLSHQTTICCLVFQYVDCLLLLKLRFKILNKKFVDIKDDMNIRFVRKKMFENIKGKKTLSTLPLKSVAAFHDKLCDCAEEMNSIFAIQILLFTISALMNVLGQMTYFISWLARKPKLDDLIISSGLIATIIYQLLSVVRASIITSAEANYTAVVLHKLMLCPASSYDYTTMRQLEVFSRQLLHRKLHFSAWGLYTLDATLLCSMIGGVFTYMVILIQFQLLSTQGRHG